MSTREIQDIIFQPCLFRFRDGGTTQGMIIARYNIREARIEYYFIPGKSLPAYRSARDSHDLNAHQRLGNPVDLSTILHAQLLN